MSCKEVCGECDGKYSNFDELEDRMTTCPWCEEGYVLTDKPMPNPNQREQRLKHAVCYVLAIAISFSFGLFVASSVIGDHVKAEHRENDRIR